ncbi:MAG TPA: tetratricopeptide repeat-containing diguanylate cyclase [Thermoanaerobaculia bacterium]|nr:tetratricopeptide repeat-containing diguanylate cyclase [Thermoanaerobaculia bacterium]
MKWLLVAGCWLLALHGLAIHAAPATQQHSNPATLFLKRGAAHEKAGRLDAAQRDYEEALGAAEHLRDRALIADAALSLGYLDYYRGDMNAALAHLQRAYEVGSPKTRRDALSSIAHVYADDTVAQYDRAIEYYRQVLAEYESAGDAINIADTLFNLGSTNERKNDLAAALDWYRRALAAEEKLGRHEEAAFVKRSIAVTLGKLDRPAEALPLLDEALRVTLAAKDEQRAMTVRQSRGIVYRKLGRIDDAIADLEATRAFYAAQNNLRFLEKTEEELAAAYAEAGRWREAYAARTRHNALQTQLAAKLREEVTSRMRIQFDVEKKDQENRSLLRVRRLQTAVLLLSAAIIVVLGFLFRRMRAMALTDELTRISNRRHLLTIAEEQRASGQPFSVIAIDVDHFKRINDSFGHAAGDVVLQRIAAACRGALRPGDRIGRVGGEELSVILPDANAAAARVIAERLRAAVESLDFGDVDPSLRATISLGVAEWDGSEPLALVTARADERLYQAKEAGRNRVAA